MFTDLSRFFGLEMQNQDGVATPWVRPSKITVCQPRSCIQFKVSGHGVFLLGTGGLDGCVFLQQEKYDTVVAVYESGGHGKLLQWEISIVKSSFQDSLKSLRESSVQETQVILFEKQIKRREQEQKKRQGVAFDWLESLLMHRQEGIQMPQIVELFVQRYTQDDITSLKIGAYATLPHVRASVFNRYNLPPNIKDAAIGFRVVRRWENESD